MGLVLFRIDVGLFFGEGGCGGLLCNNFFFLFLDILVQNLFGIKILKVYLILLEGVPIFLKGKQIKKFKLLYIKFFFFFKSRCSWEHPEPNVASPLIKCIMQGAVSSS